MRKRKPIAKVLTMSLLFAALFFMVFSRLSLAASVTQEAPEDFVNRNLVLYKEVLNKLKEECNRTGWCSGILETPVTGHEEIAKTLPQPKDLKFILNYPSFDVKEIIGTVPLSVEKAFRKAKGVFILRPSVGIHNLYGFYDKYYASDPDTMLMLNIPQEIPLSMKANLYLDTGEVRKAGTCCAKAKKTGKETVYCSSYRNIPDVKYFSNIDPRALQPVPVVVETSDGASLVDGGAKLNFNRPGRHTVTVSGFEPGYSGEKMCAGYPSVSSVKSIFTNITKGKEAKTQAVFEAIKFVDYGIPNLDFEAEGFAKPVLDYFLNADAISDSVGAPEILLSRMLGSNEANRLLSPHVRIFDGRQYRVLPCKEFPVSVRTEIVKHGPIVVDNQGYVNYIGGEGTSIIKWTMGDKFAKGKEHKFTVNVIDVVVDPDLADGMVAAGGVYRVYVLVRGDADMTKYKISGKGEGLKWDDAGFTKKGAVWVAETTVSINKDNKYPGKKIGFTLFVKNSDGSELYSKNGFVTVVSPLIEKMEIYASIGSEKPVSVAKGDSIDLFDPAKMQTVKLIPYVLPAGSKDFKPIGEILPFGEVEMVSENPSAVRIFWSPEEFTVFPAAAGKSQVTGTVKESEKVDTKAGGVSSTINVTSNRLFLTYTDTQDGKRTYYLEAIGPADMSGYSVLWKSANVEAYTGFKEASAGIVALATQKSGHYASTFTTDARRINVQLLKKGKLIAELNNTFAWPKPTIKLIPPIPPFAVLKKTALTDSSGIETSTECRRQVTRLMEQGFNPGMSADEFCKQGRVDKKEEIEMLREKQKQMNKLIDELETKGEEILLTGDTMKVGAQISNLPEELWNRVVCKWELSAGSSVVLEGELTSVQMKSEQSGGCFNIIKGIRDGFDPMASIGVELIYDTSVSVAQGPVSGARAAGTFKELGK